MVTPMVDNYLTKSGEQAAKLASVLDNVLENEAASAYGAQRSAPYESNSSIISCFLRSVSWLLRSLTVRSQRLLLVVGRGAT
jgi:hypothetical protein